MEFTNFNILFFNRIKPAETTTVRKEKKKNMKRIILAFAVIMITAITMVGQTQAAKPQKSPEERTEKIIAKMKTDLSLSDDQVSKLKPLILKREQQRKEMHEKMDDAKVDAKKAMKDSEEEFKKILTPEQYEKLKQIRKEMHDKHPQGKQGVQEN
ncbi:MAG TPA: hypothetical protein VFF27_03665 [Bacteroidia bacterium]|jgi:Spy/CpxP family protein refolding chaperone|nr:hypothetical protein [Bacteroidia bacterium]